MAITGGLSLGGLAITSQLWNAGQVTVALVVGSVSLCLASYAAQQWRIASNRRFGKTFEQQVTTNAVARLEAAGVTFRTNVRMRGVGDIDIVVNTTDGRLPVEIKSFRKWNQGIWSVGDREQRALEQARGQKTALSSSRAIIWLPQGESTFFQWLFGAGAGRVQVVFGSEKKLVKVLKRYGA